MRPSANKAITLPCCLWPDAMGQARTYLDHRFGCNGRGRFTHPLEARVLSPHEVARVQTFPDFFDMKMINKRTDLHTLIGNAVPPLMARHVLSEYFK